jgi:4-amino-4-deoxy-L-arabinose transferase-like glycosyltransferase
MMKLPVTRPSELPQALSQLSEELQAPAQYYRWRLGGEGMLGRIEAERPSTAWLRWLNASGAVRTRLISLMVGLIAFYVYWRTLAVSIAWGDSPELTAAAYQAGVPHPTGYPLYMLLGYAVTHALPFGSVAFRMNLLSALAAAAAVALLYRLGWQITRSRLAAVLTALAFGFSQTFWAQAVIAEVYAFFLLGMVALLCLLLAWEARGERRLLRAAALVYGLCFAHHLLSVLLLPGLLLWVLTSKRRGQFLRELGWTVLLFLLPLLLYLYLPWAALRDPAMNWGDPRSWPNFLAHITGRQYRGAMFQMDWQQIVWHVRQYTGVGVPGPGLLLSQFGAGFAWLALVGLYSLARRRRRLLCLTLLIYLANVLYALNYNIFDVEVYYLPSHLIVALWIGVGLRQLGVCMVRLWRRLRMAPGGRRRLNRVLGAALGIIPASLLVANWELNDRHADWSALMYARAALDALKPNALLLSGDDNYYFPLMYSRFVEHRRRDVILLSVYDLLRPERARLAARYRKQGLVVRVPPEYARMRPGTEDERLLTRIFDDNIGKRPVYLLTRPEAASYPWLAKVINRYYRVVTTNLHGMEIRRYSPPIAVTDPRPQHPRRVSFGLPRASGGTEEAAEFLGYDLKPYRRDGIPWMKLTYYWRVKSQAMARPARVWVVFTDADGQYKRKSDGSPEFHNIHPLAYGLGLGSEPLPSVLKETFDVYVPPQQWNKPLRMQLQVSVGTSTLRPGMSRELWLDLGKVPSAIPGEELAQMTGLR